ncbi:ABC transporter permease [Modicisalibacter tunisiensis]|uniref:ABC transporter permease n=1 Tax=Modicisalibacter tunisiensis TaxID=390637 RepID=UPI001CCDD024|nr:ABC transporter permease [Modicisalibacter tunisiensis]MBZ9540433.1 ABC transporter permease [Modicisalibacter tunisiensis]
MRQRLSAIRASIPVILHLARQDLVERHSGSLLGAAWTFIAPLVNILVFVLVFSRIMGAKLEGFGAEIDQYSYSIYLICGVLAWTAFANSLGRITNLYKDQSHLVTKVHVSLLALPLAVLLAETIVYLISMGFFVGFLLLIDFPLSGYWLGVPLVYALQCLSVYAVGLSLAVMAVYLKDIKEVVAVVLQVWFWVTPIVYVSQILPPWALGWMQLNPFFCIVNSYRELIMYQRIPPLEPLALFAAGTALVLCLSLWLLGRTERDLRDCL